MNKEEDNNNKKKRGRMKVISPARKQEKYLSRTYTLRRFQKEHLDKFLTLYRKNGCNGPAAAKVIGASSVLVRSWREEMPWFREAMDSILDEVFGDAASTAYKQRKKVKGAQWLLLNHAKGRELGFGQKISVDVEEKTELTLTMRLQVDQLKAVYSREELEQLHQLLSKAPGNKQPTGEDGEGDRSPADSQGGDGSGRIFPSPLH